ncbi:ABC-2 type transporter-domain-containing protein [Thamnocephalis sphaerospora]|uniref:ABC-2 type transporter-domain-containing protein n=1 Tax=Thamnocephalis sphaerospora TaxID=78915 RepID=A0A4P9XG50_9FUNG|nr:ABC-2 type transporter-domain-containing protein [Thamnocephalis sphaerospora]|eukprot:RKP04577.1 ABC-2 type transporter-domain-containing protein [Thamnocephalis sphaerospora]
MPRLGGFSLENRKYRSTFAEQFPLILQRTARHVFRDKMIFGVRLVQTLVFAVIFNLIFWKIVDRDQNAQMQDRVGVLFLFTSNLVMYNATSSLTLFIEDRPRFEREYRSGLYGLPAFFFSKIGVELPAYIIMPTLLMATTYWVMGLNPGAGRFFICCLISVLLSLSGMAIGLATASLCRDLSVALIVVPTVIMPMLIFCGLFVNFGGMPVWIRWIKWLSLVKYGFVAFVKNELEDVPIGCGANVVVAECIPVPGETVIKRLSMEDQGSVWLNIGVLAAWALVLVMLTYFGLRRMMRVGHEGAKVGKM